MASQTLHNPGCARIVFLLAVLCALLLGNDVHAQNRELEAQRVSEHVWIFEGEAGMASAANEGFMSNAGFVVTPAGVVVFDALGTPALGEAMVRAIRAVTPQPIERVIVSHYHADHYYGLQAFQALGAEIWADEAARGITRSDAARERLAQRRTDLFPFVDEHTRLIDATRWLHFDGDKPIPFEMGGVRFRILPAHDAHSPEDIMLSVDDDGVLFAGDLFFAGRLPYVGNANTRQWLSALERMAALEARVVIPGHGSVSRDVRTDLQLTRDYLTELRTQMGRAVEDMQDFEQALRHGDWRRYENLPAFDAAHRLNAYSVYLQMEQESLKK